MSGEAGSEDGITVDDVKKVSEIGPVKALLTPAAEVLGDRLKASVEKWLDRKAAKNIKEHAANVMHEKSWDDVSDQAQIELFDWAEKAGKVSPEESERSASVRAALQATLEGEHEDAKILADLTKSEILYLVNPTSSMLPSSTSFERTFPRDTLVQKALLRKVAVTVPFVLGDDRGHRRTFFSEFTLDIAKLMLVVFFVMMGASFAYNLLDISALAFGDAIGEALTTVFRVGVTLLVGLVLGAVAGIYLYLPRKYVLTWKGVEIRKKLLVYLEDLNR